LLYEIDAIIAERKDQEGGMAGDQEKEQRPDETELQWLRRLLPTEFQDNAKGFSKAASDKLPLHRTYDYKIQLKDPASTSSLGYSPLYHQSTTELEEVKRYLTENLDKGFIKPSQAPFVSPILFVKKKDSSLRFCIDYRKLNNLTRKDRYPLPLIDKTLARLARAKVYTKLDIRQAFY
jgi:hypothetical protein